MKDPRREQVSFDPYHFEKRAKSGLSTSYQEAFASIYAENVWRSPVSVSGPGSDLDQTAILRRELPILLSRIQAQSLLDLPCGDFGWMRRVELGEIQYIGGDLLDEIVANNHKMYGSGRRTFQKLDLLADELPAADVLLCRDCLVHFSFDLVHQALQNISRSGIPYLLATTFTECTENADIVTGDWRVLNLCLPPFNLPEPIYLLNEGCTEGGGLFADKCLGLWKMD